MENNASPPNYDSVQRRGSPSKHTTTVTLSASQPNLPESQMQTPAILPVPAPRRRSAGEYNLSEVSDADLKMVELGQENQGERSRRACSSCTQQWAITCTLLLTQYVCTAAVAHGFAYLRRTATDSGFGTSHFGVLAAAPMIVSTALCVLVHLPKVTLIVGLSIVTVSQIVLALDDLAGDEWIFYSHLLARCLLGVGVHFTERALQPLCHLYHRFLIFFLALAIQPMISGYLDQAASYSPAVLMSLISLAVAVLHFGLHRQQHTKIFSSAIQFVYSVEQSRSDDSNNNIGPYQITAVSRQLVFIATFYLIWGKLATIPLLAESAKLEDDYQPLMFLTFGGCALAVSVAAGCVALFIFHPRSPPNRLAFVALTVTATVAVAFVVVGLLLDSTLVLDSQETWSLFTAKALLGAGLAATAGRFFILDNNGTVCGRASIGGWPIASLVSVPTPTVQTPATTTCPSPDIVVPSTDCSTATVTVTTYAKTTTSTTTTVAAATTATTSPATTITTTTPTSTPNANTGDESSAEAPARRRRRRAPSMPPLPAAVLGASIWPLISVGGAFGVVVSTSLAANHHHWIVNVVDLVVFLAPVGLLVGESLWLWWQWQKNGDGDASVGFSSQTETSKL